MKEIYFTTETLDSESVGMLEEIHCRKGLDHVINKISNSALLVLDMQEYFLNPASHAYVPSSPPILQNINNLIHTFRKKNLPVIFTKHINTPDNAGQMKYQWKELIKLSNPLSCISPKISLECSAVIVKSQYDAFYNTNLESILRYADCRTIIICGLMTHLCCESTARSAFVRGFEVIMPIDCTASYNKRFHLSSMYNLAHGFAVITRTKEILDYFEKE